MTAYRLSLLRNKGWIRMGAMGAAIMVPVTVMEHALGCFNDGMTGIGQASEFLAAGIAASMTFGLAAGWVARGFMVRAKEPDEDERDGHGPSLTGAPRPAAPAHGKPHP